MTLLVFADASYSDTASQLCHVVALVYGKIAQGSFVHLLSWGRTGRVDLYAPLQLLRSSLLEKHLIKSFELEMPWRTSSMSLSVSLFGSIQKSCTSRSRCNGTPLTSLCMDTSTPYAIIMKRLLTFSARSVACPALPTLVPRTIANSSRHIF